MIFDMQKARDVLSEGCPGLYIPDKIWATLAGSLDRIAYLEAQNKSLRDDVGVWQKDRSVWMARFRTQIEKMIEVEKKLKRYQRAMK